MNKLIQFLKIYLKSCIFMFPFILIGILVGDLIIYYKWGSTPTDLIEYKRLLGGILGSSLTIAFLLYPIEKTVPIYDKYIFRKNLNKALTKNKFQDLSNKDNYLIINPNSIKKFIFCKELNISLYNDKAILKGSRVNIVALYNALNQKQK